MSKERKQYSPEFKFRIALEAAKNQATASQLASESGVWPSQISDWAGTLITEGASLFDRWPVGRDQAVVKMESELYEQIGRLKVELVWLSSMVREAEFHAFYTADATAAASMTTDVKDSDVCCNG